MKTNPNSHSKPKPADRNDTSGKPRWFPRLSVADAEALATTVDELAELVADAEAALAAGEGDADPELVEMAEAAKAMADTILARTIEAFGHVYVDGARMPVEAINALADTEPGPERTAAIRAVVATLGAMASRTPRLEERLTTLEASRDWGKKLSAAGNAAKRDDAMEKKEYAADQYSAALEKHSGQPSAHGFAMRDALAATNRAFGVSYGEPWMRGVIRERPHLKKPMPAGHHRRNKPRG